VPTAPPSINGELKFKTQAVHSELDGKVSASGMTQVQINGAANAGSVGGDRCDRRSHLICPIGPPPHGDVSLAPMVRN
jgi:hypothetical protein